LQKLCNFASKPEMTLLSGSFAGILTIMNQGVENRRLKTQQHTEDTIAAL